jgi:hypothetical protein
MILRLSTAKLQRVAAMSLFTLTLIKIEPSPATIGLAFKIQRYGHLLKRRNVIDCTKRVRRRHRNEDGAFLCDSRRFVGDQRLRY